MRKKIGILAGCLFTGFLTVALIMIAGRLLDPLYTSDSMNSIKAFHSMEKDSVDICFYGTSHAWKGADMLVFEEQYGMKAFNYAGNWQAFNTTLLFLKDSFRTQTPKYVFIDTYVVQSLLHDIDMEGQIYYTKAISDFPGKREFLKDCFGNDWKRYVTYAFPLVAFHDNWASIEKENFTGGKSKQEYINYRGYDHSDEVIPVDLMMCKNGAQKEIPEDSIAIMDEMADLCKNIGATLVFYTCPYVGEYEYAEALSKYADSHECEYINLIDCMDEMNLDGFTDFRDSQHLNDSGSRKLSLFLGKCFLGQ